MLEKAGGGLLVGWVRTWSVRFVRALQILCIELSREEDFRWIGRPLMQAPSKVNSSWMSGVIKVESRQNQGSSQSVKDQALITAT
jgi:hypothetical protein